MNQVRGQFTWINAVRTVTAFAIYKLVEDGLGDGTALDSNVAEVAIWVVALIGTGVVLVTFPPLNRRLPYRILSVKRAVDQALGARCINLASEMVEFLAEGQRLEPHNPPTAVPLYATEEERHRDWVRAGEAQHQHAVGVLAEFKRRFAVQLAGTVNELVRSGHMAPEEPKAMAWSMQTIHWIERIPQKLAEKGYELTEGEDP
jgi:hypothetical protein